MSHATFLQKLISSRMFSTQKEEMNQDRHGTQELGDLVRKDEESHGKWVKMPEWELCLYSGQLYRLEEWTWETGWVLPLANSSQPFNFLSTWEQYVWISHYLLNLVCVDHILMTSLHALLFRCAKDTRFTPQIFLYTYSWQLGISHGFWSRKYLMLNVLCLAHTAALPDAPNMASSMSPSTHQHDGSIVFTSRRESQSQTMTHRLCSSFLCLGVFVWKRPCCLFPPWPVVCLLLSF